MNRKTNGIHPLILTILCNVTTIFASETVFTQTEANTKIVELQNDIADLKQQKQQLIKVINDTAQKISNIPSNFLTLTALSLPWISLILYNELNFFPLG